ncbi:MAG: Tetraacyldisaccharide 4-kinase [Planctomycetota bacterium]|jgi:tetraacyldisaccharide 4'-kinase
MARDRGPLPAALSPVAWLAARAYGAVVAHRNARFDRGWGVQSLEFEGRAVPVVSVGNLVAGGTGKSPFVAWVAGALRDAGSQPVIALRGYRADAAGVSDEAAEYATTAPDARVVVGARRRERLIESFEAWRRGGEAQAIARMVVVLDDGFQHRRLARDLDIVLVDASRPALDGDLLPNGWLRERADGIARAGMVVLTKADDPHAAARAADLVARVRGRPHDAACVHAWRALELRDGDGVHRCEVGALSGKRVLSACALGNPAHFHGMVAAHAGEVAARISAPDHRAFTAARLETAASSCGADCIVISRKDLVKLDRATRVPLIVPELAIRFVAGEDALRRSVVSVATPGSSS